MPGPVSDSYDPVFGTGANAGEVRDALQLMDRVLTEALGGAEPECIVSIAQRISDGLSRPTQSLSLTEDQIRVLRYAVRETIEVT